MSWIERAIGGSAWERGWSAAREAAASQRWRLIVPWAAVPFGLVYLIRLVLHLRAVVSAVYLDADSAAAPVIGQLFSGGAPHAHVLLGTFDWYSTLLFELGTRWLPFHRQIWELAPYAMALAAAGLVGWAVWRIAGAAAASLSVVLLVCASPRMLHLLLSTTEHGPVWLCSALLGLVVVLGASRSIRLRGPFVALLIVLVGLLVGVNAASDPLVLIGGIAPLIIAALVAHALTRSGESVRLIQLSAGVLAVTGVVGLVTTRVMAHYDVTSCACPSGVTHLAHADQVPMHFQLWWQGVVDLSNGWFFGAKLTFGSLLMVACALLGLAAMVALPRIAWSELRLRTAQPDLPHPEARLAFISYWTSSAALLTLAFLISADPVNLGADRYLAGVIYAAAAIIPALSARRRIARAAVLVGTILFALSATLSIGKATPDQPVVASDAAANAVARIAAQNHVSVGYSGYWDAAPFTWVTHFRIRIYPVKQCGPSLCRFYEHIISSWYTPRPGIRTFLLEDPTLPAGVSPPAALGSPSAVYRVGRMTMYVYPYDLASRIGPIASP